MGLLIGGWIVAATVCASLATVLLLIWVQDRRTLSYPILAIAALAASGLAVAEIRMAGATSIAAYLAGFKLSNYCVAVLLIGLAWFIVTYSGTRQRLLAWFTTFVWLIGTVLNAIRPTGLALAEISGLETMTTLWGESYTVAIARVDASKLFADTGAVAVMLLAFQACLSLWRADAKRRAVLLATIGLFLGFALVHTTLVDLGYLASPYMISYLFVGIVVVTSYELALRVASEASLSERVRLDEQRWRTLLEEVELLVARIRIDGVIEYANPCFCRVSGYTAGELTGSDIRALLPETDRQSLFRQLDAGLRGRHDSGIETSLTTKTGDLRTIVWSRVFFQQTGSDVPEVLSVGADITAQRQAEDDRDQALKAIAALKSQLEEENLYLKEQIKIEIEGDFAEIVGETEALRYVLFRTEQVAATDTSVLIQGETGVGKELVARAVHERSRRSKAPFVRVNCAALPPNLVESELFGHVAGAFTDAKEKRIGRFELADGGTLFLDEVSELPLELQPKLLRVLQDGQFDPVGSSETYKADVRLIAATNRNLKEQIDSGRFREDLFYRLNVYPITVPPLRDRAEDIPLLVEFFLPRISAKVGKVIEEVPAAVLRSLQAYSWPGNVRQLQNILEEAVVLSEDRVLRLPTHFGTDPRKDRESTTVLESLADAERKHIRKALETTHGQVAGRGGAAEILDLHPNTLRSRMKKLGLGAK
jgi:PAS domain S-box-containing protein